MRKIPIDFSNHKLAIEAIVIVGSILFSFTIDAWWDSRVESQKITSQLETTGPNYLRLMNTFPSSKQI
jgi:hypothetical protein